MQYAVQDGQVYVLEVNPRASRTVPFVAKATGLPLARLATKIMLGKTLRQLGVVEPQIPPLVSIKQPVFPFVRFPGEDPVLGPEMKSTGEVMGIGANFGEALCEAYRGAGIQLPRQGTAFLSVHDRDKQNLPPVARGLATLGFGLFASGGTAYFLRAEGLAVQKVYRVNEGRPHVVDKILSGEIQLVINTPLGEPSFYDERAMRLTALARRIPLITTLSGAASAVEGIRAQREDSAAYRALQEIHVPA